MLWNWPIQRRNTKMIEVVSELKVMRSAAGWYVGRSYWDTDLEFEGPWSRESDYFADRDDAMQHLHFMRGADV